MLAYCGRPPAASFGDRYSYIVPRYARVTIAETCSLGVALATAIISQTGSSSGRLGDARGSEHRGQLLAAHERHDGRPRLHGITVAELDQGPRISALKGQVARELKT